MYKKYYKIMQAFETVGTIDNPDWWDELSPEQQMELETALAECDNPSKLTAHEEVVKMSKQWLQE